ncbi:BadF/BadG/BcrA/BcrD ATPase family protein [Actinosynnema sp. NPDC020468]|uniref:N-acetylglucosamine kinase n=1 Tax=Actinosynnema sp. NPDC020468 TaxID=3154488 RepID=UPI0033CBF75C
MGFFVGLDAGGTATRALVLDVDGSRLGAGVAGGANPHSHPPEKAAEHVEQALRAALDGLDARKVQSGVLGMAGTSRMADPRVSVLFEQAWASSGLRCPMRVITDAEAAFASGSPAPDGTVLIAGTGSIGARIEDHRLTSTTGGDGWLLGDEGSAYWLGREAVRATLRALEAGTESPLTKAVLGRAKATTRRQLIAAVNAVAPVVLATYAPLVTANAADPAADAIISAAVAHLTALALAGHTPGTPLVLTGSLIHAHPLGAALRRSLARRGPGPITTTTNGAPGAAWLAAVATLGAQAPRPA